MATMEMSIVQLDIAGDHFPAIMAPLSIDTNWSARWINACSTKTGNPRRGSSPYSTASATPTTPARSTPAGPSAPALAHLAFFDRRVARLVERIDAGDRSASLFELNVDITNDALKPAWIGLTAAAVAAESRAAADEGDAAIEHLADDVVQFVTEHGYIRVGRFKHRNEHIDEIEALLGSA